MQHRKTGASLSWVALLPVFMIGAPLCGAPAYAQEPGWRIRADNTSPLNENVGWAGEIGQSTIVTADQPFRVRIESGAHAADGPVFLQVRRNDGPWVTLEAHDFPYPERQTDVDLANVEEWVVLRGEPSALSVVRSDDETYLEINGGETGFKGIKPLPWPTSQEITIAVGFRLVDRSSALSLTFGATGQKDYSFARFLGEGEIIIGRHVNGTDTVLTRIPAPVSSGAWHEAELALEDGELTVELDDATILGMPYRAAPGQAGIAVSPGGSASLSDLVFEGVQRTPGISIVSTPAYENGSSTTDLLDGEDTGFNPGVGLSLWDRAPVAVDPGQHSEYEWPLVIRRTSDGPSFYETGDRFGFRLADASGEPIADGGVAEVTLQVPDGHLGGTFVETPGRIGPWQASNGDLYFIMEPAETENVFMMMKSVDGGKSWNEVDGTNRPVTGDLESVDARAVGDSIAILHQVTDSLRYHVFNTSDHPTNPDSWAIRDEIAAELSAVAQMATMTPRSDGSIVAVFLANRLHLAIRDTDGAWSEPVELDTRDAFLNAGPQAVVGKDDTVHLAYFSDDGRIWYRAIAADGALGQRMLIAEGPGNSRAEYGAVLPLVYHPESDSITIAYRLADGSLWERSLAAGRPPSEPRRITPGPVVTDAVDSQQAGADLIETGGGLVALYIDACSRSIFSVRKNGGAWSDPVLEIDGIEGSWVRGSVIRKPDGGEAIGYVYDAGSQGGTGMNRYAELSQDDL